MLAGVMVDKTCSLLYNILEPGLFHLHEPDNGAADKPQVLGLMPGVGVSRRRALGRGSVGFISVFDGA